MVVSLQFNEIIELMTYYEKMKKREKKLSDDHARGEMRAEEDAEEEEEAGREE